MNPSTVVKIDVAGSKTFATSRQTDQPGVRADLLTALVETSKVRFPRADEPYPKGTFYKADGDAVWFVFDHASVALRASIEFMQAWYQLTTEGYPECRVFLDTGHLSRVDVPGKVELVGKPFENISMFEKGQPAGGIYLTEATVGACDRTMAKFAFHASIDQRPAQALSIYRVEFLDPRTIEDSALVHALFVAHPEAQNARERVLELFVFEYLQEHRALADIDAFLAWSRQKSYPVGPAAVVEKRLASSEFIEKVGGSYCLTDSANTMVAEARAEFSEALGLCLEVVSASVVASTRTVRSLEGVKLQELIEDYLGTVFSQMRLMANYFRTTSQLFSSDSDGLRSFDYVLLRHLPRLDRAHFEEWRVGFLGGIKQCADSDNKYLAALFHNVLAIYYLNRATQTSAYQVEKLRARQFYVDTNALYALTVKASQFNDILAYIAGQLSGLGLRMKVLPFTVDEYEQSLLRVEHLYHNGRPEAKLLDQNPWLLQEFELHRGKYLDRMSVCRQSHSISPRFPVTTELFDEVDGNLRARGLSLERDFTEIPDEDARALWEGKLRHAMARDSWELSKYYEFFSQLAARPEELNVHDAKCIAAVGVKAEAAGSDELGPIVLFLTLDYKRLLRLRHKYRFIIGVQQFLEFFLPYLFLNDVPVADSVGFPNRLLSAQLATLLVKRPPKMVEVAAAFLREPEAISAAKTGHVSPALKKAAIVLSGDRFKEITKHSAGFDAKTTDDVASGVAAILGDIARREQEAYYSARAVPLEIKERENALREKEEELADERRKLEKAKKEINYLRGQVAGSTRRARPGRGK